MPEVVVTGMGTINPVGANVPDTWGSILAGRSGISAIAEEWAQKLPSHIAGRMIVDPAGLMDRIKARRLDRSMQGALIAAKEAWADAGSPDVDGERLAVVIGTGIGGFTTLMDNHEILLSDGYRHISPRMVQNDMPNGSAAAVSIELGAQAGAFTPVSACASGAEAIAQGLDLIRLNRADVVVVGGTEACVHPLGMAGFSQARALSTRNDDPERASRPFDKGRDGFVLAEGAAVLVLERAADAAARRVRPYARLAGAGITSDAHDMVSPHPTGGGQTRAIRAALRDAQLVAGDIVHINAHATSTPLGDRTEASSVRGIFGDAPVVSATKSMTGHLLGAAGALEGILTMLAVRDGIAPPTANLTDPEDLGLDVTRAQGRKMDIPAALSNSFGFGGHNVALVFTPA